MLILLSPAKNLDFSPAPPELPRTPPSMATETKKLVAIAKKLTAKDLAGLMDISAKLADLNHARFQDFRLKPVDGATKQAALAFNGDVYQGLNAKTLKTEDLVWAQDRLRILSGLYGLLRPLDAIQPYRLEMGIKLANDAGPDLYAFWRNKIAKALDKEAGGVIVNLASDEYFSAVDRKALKTPVISPTFKEVKDGKAKAIFMYVKRARGLMARYAIENRIEDPEALKAFSVGGYKFDAKRSSGEDWVFTRPQPKPAMKTAKAAKRA